MSLELHIYGPGFGETIFIRWTAGGGGWHGALVDACCPTSGHWLANKLRALDLKQLEFVVATHPHYDHMRGLARSLSLSQCGATKIFYWPSLTPRYWISYYDQLANQQSSLGPIAREVREWFLYLKQQGQKNKTQAWDIGGSQDKDEEEVLHQSMDNGERLRVTCIGPWFSAINNYVSSVTNTVNRAGRITPGQQDANLVSVALLVEYGKAQVVLAGDMQRENWSAFKHHASCDCLNPCVVKVSHHGSLTGCANGMWLPSQGFFGGMADNQIAVVTPWRLGGKELPDMEVVDLIRNAGLDVYMTGCFSDPRTKHGESHISLEVEGDGTVKVLEQLGVKRFARVTPLSQQPTQP